MADLLVVGDGVLCVERAAEDALFEGVADLHLLVCTLQALNNLVVHILVQQLGKHKRASEEEPGKRRGVG
jgi:hypothetical protein